MISFILNNKKVSVDVESDTPLLWVLRDELKLKGTKFGCGKGLCGACTIHLNGSPIRSCVFPISAVENQSITTLEGILDDENYQKLQKQWIKKNVPQCGYCQPGQLMTATALLKSNNNPSKSEIQSAMAGNICRCGTYQRIQEAILDAAKKGEKNE
ncbi:MAG: (2Fe-2S)-binding protein [Candidatus Cloacimonadota bacterium]|nr:MAG: (2Fe-2S)-binding protein [Candidatus Cloacimonadota bacterium]